MASMEEHPVLGVLRDMQELVASKAADYADSDDVYSNFTGAAQSSNVTVEQTFQVLIGVKIERLRQLTSGKEPNHEGIEDTLLDLANYAALWLGYRRQEQTDMIRLVDGQLQLPVDKTVMEWYTDDDPIQGVPI